MWTSWSKNKTVASTSVTGEYLWYDRLGLVLKWRIKASSPREFSTAPLGMGVNLPLCAFWAAALFWKHAWWELPLLSGSRSRPLQSCGWWSVRVEGSWGRGWAAGTASVGQRALRTGYLSVPQLLWVKTNLIETFSGQYRLYSENKLRRRQ